MLGVSLSRVTWTYALFTCWLGIIVDIRIDDCNCSVRSSGFGVREAHFHLAWYLHADIKFFRFCGLGIISSRSFFFFLFLYLYFGLCCSSIFFPLFTFLSFVLLFCLRLSVPTFFLSSYFPSFFLFYLSSFPSLSFSYFSQSSVFFFTFHQSASATPLSQIHQQPRPRYYD